MIEKAKQLRITAEGRNRSRLIAKALLPFFCFLLSVSCDSKTELKTQEQESNAVANPDSSGTLTVEPDGVENPNRERSTSTAPAPASRDQIIARAEESLAHGKPSEAAEHLKAWLIRQPDDAEVIFRLAASIAASGDMASAIEYLNEIPIDHPEAGLAAQGQAADWCISLGRYVEAEQRYHNILGKAPNAATALRQLAFLLNRQGRRQEASDLVRRLCLQGNVMQDELHSLIAMGDAMHTSPTGPENSHSRPTRNGARRYFPISPYGDARLAFQQQRYADVIALLQPTIESSEAPAAMHALFGRAAAEMQDDATLNWWFEHLHPRASDFADYWATLGILELMQQRYDSATRALGEALQRDSTDLASVSRMRQALGSQGKPEQAERWFQRWTDLRATVDANNRIAATALPDADAVESLAMELEKLDRRLEAILWRATLAHSDPTGQKLAKLQAELKAVLLSGEAFPDSKSRLCGLELEQHPLPDLATAERPPTSTTKQPDFSNTHLIYRASFLDRAESLGLHQIYRVAAMPQEKRYAIYQTLGGGVAVLDYELDGRPDLYFAQGAADPPNFQGRQPNQLFRNLGGSVADSTPASGAGIEDYSMSVAAGDWNQDGFPDLAIASIGSSVLLVNNGDGTFNQRLLHAAPDTNRVPGSVAIADLTGSGLPDLIELGYVDDATHSTKPPVDEDGNVLITVGPSSFQAATDHMLVSLGDGSFEKRELTDSDDARTGLGLIIADFDGIPGNELFIGNDSRPNRVWKFEGHSGQKDLAAILGCAYGFSGGATGAMGIAGGDFDHNMKMDLFVTNFENENANLYLRRRGAFQDRNRQYGLAEASNELVGFGTQAIDYDNDGDEDLVVTNGHLDDAQSIRGTYTQPMQLFCNVGNGFRLLEVEDHSGFWGVGHVGRALATLDFDRDGRTDFVVNQVERPSALMINQSENDNRWLQIRLAGSRSERDAIGTRVELQFGGRRSVQWNVAGDGYFCSNEKVMSFGLGAARSVSRMEVHWPTGEQQIFENIPSNRRLLIVEKQPDWFELATAP